MRPAREESFSEGERRWLSPDQLGSLLLSGVRLPQVLFHFGAVVKIESNDRVDVSQGYRRVLLMDLLGRSALLKPVYTGKRGCQ